MTPAEDELPLFGAQLCAGCCAQDFTRLLSDPQSNPTRQASSFSVLENQGPFDQGHAASEEQELDSNSGLCASVGSLPSSHLGGGWPSRHALPTTPAAPPTPSCLALTGNAHHSLQCAGRSTSAAPGPGRTGETGQADEGWQGLSSRPGPPPARSSGHLLQVVPQEVQLGLTVHGGQLGLEPRADALRLGPRGVVLEELVLGLLETQPLPPACGGSVSIRGAAGGACLLAWWARPVQGQAAGGFRAARTWGRNHSRPKLAPAQRQRSTGLQAS